MVWEQMEEDPGTTIGVPEGKQTLLSHALAKSAYRTGLSKAVSTGPEADEAAQLQSQSTDLHSNPQLRSPEGCDVFLINLWARSRNRSVIEAQTLCFPTRNCSKLKLVLL